jgi:hypothetical protein
MAQDPSAVNTRTRPDREGMTATRSSRCSIVARKPKMISTRLGWLPITRRTPAFRAR